MFNTIMFLLNVIVFPALLAIFGGYIIVTGDRDDARKRKAKREKAIKHIGS